MIEHVRPDGTDLSLARLCMGTMTFGGQADESTARAMIDLCLERGIDFIDTANVYTGGASEEILGRILRGRRHQVVLASKVGMEQGALPGEQPLSRSAIVRSLDTSLQRLQTDYLDLFYMHKPDYGTPLEETLGVMGEQVAAGKVRYVAASNYASWQMCRMQWLADRDPRLPAVRITQPMYNLIARGLEPEYLPMCAALGLYTWVYNPLAGGLLTGKHRSGEPTPGTRFTVQQFYVERYWRDSNFSVVTELQEAAQAAGRSLVSLALCWLLHHTPISGIILGASRLEQLQQNLAACEEGPLNPDTLAVCDRVWRQLRGPSAQYNR